MNDQTRITLINASAACGTVMLLMYLAIKPAWPLYALPSFCILACLAIRENLDYRSEIAHDSELDRIRAAVEAGSSRIEVAPIAAPAMERVFSTPEGNDGYVLERAHGRVALVLETPSV